MIQNTSGHGTPIFPHKDYVSVGCGANPKVISTGKLRQNFHRWLEKQNISYAGAKFEAAMINYDYKGYHFRNVFLIGDAAGLAGGLTGEGIYQAIISGEEIAKIILDPKYHPKKIEKLLKTKKLENRVLNFLIAAGWFRNLIFELLALLARSKTIARKIGKALIQ